MSVHESGEAIGMQAQILATAAGSACAHPQAVDWPAVSATAAVLALICCNSSPCALTCEGRRAIVRLLQMHRAVCRVPGAAVIKHSPGHPGSQADFLPESSSRQQDLHVRTGSSPGLATTQRAGCPGAGQLTKQQLVDVSRQTTRPPTISGALRLPSFDVVTKVSRCG
jgi:hypothetical protein